jgi:flagellar motility protein MotE (MotC chaperone)
MTMTAPSPNRVFHARSGLLAATAFAAMMIAGGSAATETAAPAPIRMVEATATAVPAEASAGTEIERFCSNIADAARDRRYSLQAQELQQLQQGIDERVKLLEEKRAEYESWLKRREDFLAQAEDKLVKIYGGMRPDAAAERLAEIDAELAAGILMKLDTRKAGVILNEMESKAAAMLTGVMASAARRTDPT